MATADDSEKAQRNSPAGEEGNASASAQRIEWSQLYARHLSMLECHSRMLETIQKQINADSDNWRTITSMVDRSHEIIEEFKNTTTTFKSGEEAFLPPSSSLPSETVHPVSHSADHTPDVPRQDAGRDVEELRRGTQTKSYPKSLDPKVEGYTIGQRHGLKRKFTVQIKDQDTNGQAGSVRKGAHGSGQQKVETSDGKRDNTPVDEVSDNPYFVIDTKPSPVNLANRSKPKIKVSADIPRSESSEKRKSKKRKTDKSSKQTPVTEFEDISAEVDTRLREKEEKRKRKEEKKRKRDSTGKGDVSLDKPIVEGAVSRPKKSKKEGERTPEKDLSEKITKESKRNHKDIDLRGKPNDLTMEGARRKKKRKTETTE
ncbi:MAG: hypothetical protein M1837_004836 [Sclerophora amabilis]|nr:MAG: hypothetical protein M1837_004836 [Sclerophora amabilis]